MKDKAKIDSPKFKTKAEAQAWVIGFANGIQYVEENGLPQKQKKKQAHL